MENNQNKTISFERWMAMPKSWNRIDATEDTIREASLQAHYDYSDVSHLKKEMADTIIKKRKFFSDGRPKTAEQIDKDDRERGLWSITISNAEYERMDALGDVIEKGKIEELKASLGRTPTKEEINEIKMYPEDDPLKKMIDDYFYPLLQKKVILMYAEKLDNVDERFLDIMETIEVCGRAYQKLIQDRENIIKEGILSAEKIDEEISMTRKELGLLYLNARSIQEDLSNEQEKYAHAMGNKSINDSLKLEEEKKIDNVRKEVPLIQGEKTNAPTSTEIAFEALKNIEIKLTELINKTEKILRRINEIISPEMSAQKEKAIAGEQKEVETAIKDKVGEKSAKTENSLEIVDVKNKEEVPQKDKILKDDIPIVGNTVKELSPDDVNAMLLDASIDNDDVDYSYNHEPTNYSKLNDEENLKISQNAKQRPKKSTGKKKHNIQRNHK